MLPKDNVVLQAKAWHFLELLREYDQQYKKQFEKDTKAYPYLMDFPDNYCVLDHGRVYLWIDAPYLRFAVTEDGKMYLEKGSWSRGRYFGNIDWFIKKHLWGKKIWRRHYTAKRGTGGNCRYGDSAVFRYYDLQYKF